ncbi:hypothetical protein [Mycolicibacterium fortuitum]|uniref:hypothetical protein n=1 Tax=Mycolicibacterium fortuitum TaxID=1766 RepID=UPI0007EB0974|nr:hypothetical protein [Mycolicibacterium fortuitum]OBB49802.1 hypothetical protein A5754_29535 [Mycolicibacterium fortuitum]OBB51562.1 hypothetical protein A5755_00080 [Mycolicibacterium fortuitum]OBF76644.1 hypothetical protein A5751_23815 [Mycolicibacterium fortuitum]OBG17536.1 hypothetical protein A5768_03315 [Mycolicibacterium fortuitum]
MAVRPLVTTGVALLSAGALVAGTPALFVPRDEITVAASTAEATVHRTMTAEQINLVALSLEGALGSFLDGYGGYYYQGYVPAPTPGYILNEDGTKLLEPDEDTPANTALVGPDGKPLYRLDADGQATIPATVGDMGAGVQFYDRAGNKVNENFYDPGNCSATGAMCHDGFTGLAYYLSDNILPLDVFDNIFFEAGATEFAYLGSVVAASFVDAFDPTQRLQLSKRVDEFFTGGAAMVVGSILNDNLPDGSFVQNLSNSFFFGYGDATGITAAVTYIVDTVRELISAPESEETDSVSLLSAQQETPVKTEAEPGSVTSTSLPNVSKLLSLPTDIESSFKKLAEKLEAPAESKLVKTLEVKAEDTTVDEAAETAEESSGAVAPAVEVSKPEAPKFELPKLDLGLKLTPKTTTTKEVAEVKETAAQEESEDKAGGTESADTGAATKAPNKFAPKSSTTERKKSAGEKFVENATKNLEKAFKPTTKAGADKQDTAKGAAATGASAKGASGGDSSAHAGNAHADNKDSKSNDTKGNKDNKDSKSHKDK